MENQTPEYYWEQWKKKPSPQNMAIAVKTLDKEINNFANSYSGSINPSVARSKARSFAIDAIKTYDPKMGAALKTHFFNHIRPLARETKSLVESVSLSKHYETNANKYVNFVNSFVADNGREPDDSEILDGLSISPKQLKVLNSTIKYEMPEAQLENFNFEDPNDGYNQKIDLWTDFVYHDLSPRGKKILDLKMGRSGHPPMSNIEIAQKLNIHPKEVAQYSQSIAQKILDGVNTKSKGNNG
jgi:DNA-directed RNA polymerase specialized sigma subunit